MEKRVRSPNYPAISLREAIDKVAALYKSIHIHPGPREVIAKGMGYASLNGSSMTAISALNKYGLLEGRGDEIKVSDRAMRILHPESEKERVLAIKSAALDPHLFAELDERFTGTAPNDELLRNYLLRRNFSSVAVSQVILSYRETKEFVEAESSGYDSPSSMMEGSHEMPPEPSSAEFRPPPADFKKALLGQQDERSIGRYDFEGGGYVRIMAGGEIATEEALEMAETVIALKRKEIERRKSVGTVGNQERDEELPSDADNENNA